MVAGRPPTDLKKLADDLLQWSTNPTAFNLIQFSRPRMFSVTRLADYAAKDKEFSEALKLAKESIAMNRFEAMLEGALPLDEYKRNEHAYDPLRERLVKKDKLLDVEMEIIKMDHAHKLKTKENSDLSQQDAERYSNALKAKSLIKECG